MPGAGLGIFGRSPHNDLGGKYYDDLPILQMRKLRCNEIWPLRASEL